MFGDKILVSATVKETTIELLYRQEARYTYNTSTFMPIKTPDKIWKEIYGLKDGRMTLLEVVSGKHIPAYNVPESYEFEE
jgi:hypothetical protein